MDGIINIRIGRCVPCDDSGNTVGTLAERSVVEGSENPATPLSQAALRGCEEEKAWALASRESEKPFHFGGKSLLDTLPEEIVCYILSFLRGREIALSSQVCRFFKRVFETEAVLIKAKLAGIFEVALGRAEKENGQECKVLNEREHRQFYARNGVFQWLALLNFYCYKEADRAFKISHRGLSINSKLAPIYYKETEKEKRIHRELLLKVAKANSNAAKTDAQVREVLRRSLILGGLDEGSEWANKTRIKIIAACLEGRLEKAKNEGEAFKTLKAAFGFVPSVEFDCPCVGYWKDCLLGALIIVYAKYRIETSITDVWAEKVSNEVLKFLSRITLWNVKRKVGHKIERILLLRPYQRLFREAGVVKMAAALEEKRLKDKSKQWVNSEVGMDAILGLLG